MMPPFLKSLNLEMRPLENNHRNKTLVKCSFMRPSSYTIPAFYPQQKKCTAANYLCPVRVAKKKRRFSLHCSAERHTNVSLSGEAETSKRALQEVPVKSRNDNSAVINYCTVGKGLSAHCSGKSS